MSLNFGSSGFYLLALGIQVDPQYSAGDPAQDFVHAKASSLPLSHTLSIFVFTGICVVHGVWCMCGVYVCM